MVSDKSGREVELEFAARLEQIAAGIRAGDLGVMEFADLHAPRGGGFLGEPADPCWKLTMTYLGIRGQWMMDPDGNVGWQGGS